MQRCIDKEEKEKKKEEEEMGEGEEIRWFHGFAEHLLCSGSWSHYM